MLVTGANGFIGRALCAEAVSRGMTVRGITRASGYLPVSVEKLIKQVWGEYPLHH